MSIDITRQPVSFTSSDGDTTIHGYIWSDSTNEAPNGIVQIAHGMAEHIERYDDFARYLVENGFIVAGHDHLAHGKSVSESAQWGCLDAHDGMTHLVEDMHRMRKLVKDQMPAGTPYFVFGHSMGSFVVRSYITKHGDGLAGAIICGTGHMGGATASAGRVLACCLAAMRGKGHESKLLDSMGVGAYNKKIKNPRTPVDWLSYNEENVDAYVADDACGFMFPAGGYATVIGLMKEVCSKASAAAVPLDLPVLFISGADDPVGAMGNGVRTTVNMMRAAGVRDIESHIYRDMRHEILNETDNARVYSDVLSWLKAHARKGE